MDHRPKCKRFCLQLLEENETLLQRWHRQIIPVLEQQQQQNKTKMKTKTKNHEGFKK